jgi:GT2 family glycosyltransferase
MCWPKVSLIWINYNSSKILPVVFESIESISRLDYPSDRYELIIVDNGSTDGSFESIKEFLERKSHLRKKIIRLAKNSGFTGGNNIGFRARDPDSKYVALVNNDVMLIEDSLKNLVELLRGNSRIGAVQGILLKLTERNIVDTAGDFFVDVYPFVRPFLSGFPYKALKKPYKISFADGAFAVYSIEALVRSLGRSDRIFDEVMFAYFDDNILGIKLWCHGYYSILLPRIVGYHARSSTFGHINPFQHYLINRGHYVFATLFGTPKMKLSLYLQSLRFLTPFRPKALKSLKDYKQLIFTRVLALKHSTVLAKYLLSSWASYEDADSLSLERVPLIKLSLRETIHILIDPSRFQHIVDQSIARSLHNYYYEESCNHNRVYSQK